MTVYKVKDAIKVRDHINTAISVAIQEALQMPVSIKINSSNIMHTDLQPEGAAIAITVVVEIHKKEVKDAPATTE